MYLLGNGFDSKAVGWEQIEHCSGASLPPLFLPGVATPTGLGQTIAKGKGAVPTARSLELVWSLCIGEVGMTLIEGPGTNTYGSGEEFQASRDW